MGVSAGARVRDARREQVQSIGIRPFDRAALRLIVELESEPENDNNAQLCISAQLREAPKRAQLSARPLDAAKWSLARAGSRASMGRARVNEGPTAGVMMISLVVVLGFGVVLADIVEKCGQTGFFAALPQKRPKNGDDSRAHLSCILERRLVDIISELGARVQST